MDNQQERPEVKAAWLAGLFEADGSFMLGYNSNKKSKYFQYEPIVTFVNTDGVLMKGVHEALDSFSVGHHIAVRAQLGFGAKPIFQLQVQGMKRCKTLLPILIPYLHGVKKLRAQIMLRFIEYRLSLPKNHGYGETERGLREEYLATQKESSETVRWDPSGV